jgi:type IV pilus assembly protein PilA
MAINPNAAERAKSRGWKFWAILSVALILSLVCLLLFFLVVLHDSYSEVARNESAAVGSLHRINTLERPYNAGHANTGFGCERALLRPTAQMRNADGPDETFLTGEERDYKFKLVGCSAEISGIVTHSQVVATPVRPGATGIRAFCTDESGEVFYDPDASAAKCLASRNVIP